MKRQYFNTRRNDIIENFAETWFVDPEQLYSSALQYRAKMDGVPNNSGIMNNIDFNSFKEVNPDISKIAYLGKLIPEWEKVLMEIIMFLDDELK